MLSRDAPDVAPLVLGALLVSSVGGREVSGRIVEVEAYRQDDPASHSFGGPTRRNRAMFGPPGHLYVYLSYGIHRCANVVTGPPGDGQALLVRAVVPVGGRATMRARRRPTVAGPGDRGVADGPGKLCQAFGIDLVHDGVDLCSPESAVRLVDDGDGPPPSSHVRVGPRVGISRAVDVPWRFRLEG